KQRMRGDLDGQIDVAAAAARAGGALPREPDLLAWLHAGRDLHPQGAGLGGGVAGGRRRCMHRDLAGSASVGVLQADGQGPVLIGWLAAAALHAVEHAAAAALAAAVAAEQALEEIAEDAFRAVDARLLPAGRRTEVLAGAPVVAQPVVHAAPLRVLQHLVSFGDFLEASLGSWFLADIRMVFAGEPAIGRLDLVGSCMARHPEQLVIILVFHRAVLAWRLVERRDDTPDRGTAGTQVVLVSCRLNPHCDAGIKLALRSTRSTRLMLLG